MTTEHGGSGDPRRTLELLWRTKPAPARGPKPRLTLEQIVQAAIDVADAEGLTALSMRRVAERLDAGTMTLYRYVPSKGELLDLMLDAVVAEPGLPDPPEPSAGWRARLEHVAWLDWRLFHRHPWMLQVSNSRQIIGPNSLKAYDASLEAAAGTGLDEAGIASIIELLDSYVRGAAKKSVDAEEVARRTGKTQEEWWYAVAPLLDEYITYCDYPMTSRVAAAEVFGWGPEVDFERGLGQLFDGIEASLEK